MPQMSPLMWGPLTLTFSFLLVLVVTQAYFSYFKPLPPTILAPLVTLKDQSTNWPW